MTSNKLNVSFHVAEQEIADLQTQIDELSSGNSFSGSNSQIDELSSGNNLSGLNPELPTDQNRSTDEKVNQILSLMADLAVRMDSIEVQNRLETRSGSRLGSLSNRRETVNVGDKLDVFFDDLPKSLKDPKIVDTYSAKFEDDLEAHILKISLSLGFTPPQYHGAYLAQTLRGAALTAFRSKFSKPNEVT